MSKFGDLMQSFIMSNPKRAMWFFSKVPESFWLKLGEKKALEVFRDTSSRVAAFKDHLEKSKIELQSIKTIKDFQAVPITDRKNYLHKHSLEDLSATGLEYAYWITKSSGASGRSQFWPRLPDADAIVPKFMEIMYTQFLEVNKIPGLIVITLALGSWVAGEIMAESSRAVAKKYKTMTVVNPGTDAEDAIETIKEIGHHYEQIIIMGYPDVLKHIADLGKSKGINWSDNRVRIITGGEVASESWRNYMRLKLEMEESDLCSILALFAAADVGMIGFETPVTSLIRQLLVENDSLRNVLFGCVDIPSIVQYFPMAAYIEQHDGEIVFTSRNAIPMVRYNIRDRGFTITLQELDKKLKEQGYDLYSLFLGKGYPKSLFLNLPFLVVFGRSDAVIIDGANIYREDIEFALEGEHRNEIAGYKLAIETVEQQNMQFCIYLELDAELNANDDTKKCLAKKYHDFFVKKLPEINMDFRDALKVNPTGLDPKIRIFDFRDGPFKDEDKRIKRHYIV